uniref:G_PROTEIN_RECEP_F1_2 domain-containing protein n=1 Tax=Rhabditophanes sp. KR3021 TaxID=114890 RepID=A0AC35U6T4_9BILA
MALFANESSTQMDKLPDFEEDCPGLTEKFNALNSYFRDDYIFPKMDHGSYWVGWVVIAVYSFVIVFGAVGNFLTILIVIRSKQMRTVQNFFIINLALGDFLICTLTAPLTLYTVLYVFWPFGNALCKVTSSLQGANVFLSTFSITAIALDRYVLIIFPTKQERQKKLSFFLFAMIWTTSIMLAFPLFIAADQKNFDIPCDIGFRLCQEQNDNWERMPISKTTYTTGLLITQYALPIISMIFAYTKIASRMQGRFVNRMSKLSTGESEIRRRCVADRQRRTNLLLASLVLVFAGAWLPFNVFHMVVVLGFQKFRVEYFVLCHIIAMGSACLNPVCYAFFNQNFRNEFFVILHKLKLRKNTLGGSFSGTEYTTTVKKSTFMTPRSNRRSFSTANPPEINNSCDNSDRRRSKSISDSDMNLPLVPLNQHYDATLSSNLQTNQEMLDLEM